jgi:ubiquinone/menaquinone biosynthesis C-methylase UbiE
VILQPLDYGYRAINCKQFLPPLRLRRYVGPLGSFESSGAEFLRYLRELAGLRRDESVLDIGCGCGLMALQLENYLNAEGRYTGVDIHAPSIRWCVKHISARHPNFQFARVNASNSVFNPNGEPATEFRFPFPDKMFDVILVKSVFTHMRLEEIDNYLSEIARLLKDGGRCLATFFLLNEKQGELKQQGLNQLHFEFGDDISRYVYKHSPESAIAHREDLVVQSMREHNLVLVHPVLYGTWSGSRDGASFQDMLLIEKARA